MTEWPINSYKVPEILLKYAQETGLKNPVMAIAAKTGIRRSVVSSYLDGRSSPTYPNCKVLSSRLGLERQTLMKAAGHDRAIRRREQI